MESQPLIYFVSYSRADEAFALKLAEQLLAEGVSLWIDQINILPGNRWDRAIEEALESSQGLLVLLSSTSVESDNVMDEVSYALEQGKQVIPVLFETCEIPFRLRRLQYIDLTTDFEKGLAVLVKNLKAIGTAEAPQKLLQDPLNPPSQKAESSEKLAEVIKPANSNQQLHNFWANRLWKLLAYTGLGVVFIFAAVAYFWKGPLNPERPLVEAPPKEKTEIEPNIRAIETALKSSEQLEQKAIERTNEISSKTWDDSKFDREWTKIEDMWEAAANNLAIFLPVRSQSTNVANLVETRVKPRHHEYLNRKVLTSAMHDHHKSIFLADQPANGSPEQCDVDATFADSQKKWEPILMLRKQAVEKLNSVSEDVSFHSSQVLLARDNYENNLKWANRFYQSSPWYYAIQKAVCATNWGEKAKKSNNLDDWIQSATFWERGIERLENAPDEIPLDIPEDNRKNYQKAVENLDLWRRNLENAKARSLL